MSLVVTELSSGKLGRTAGSLEVVSLIGVELK